MMAYTYPLSLAEFFEGLAFVDWTLDFNDVTSMVETRGGRPIKVSNGDPLWFGTLTIKPLLHAQADAILAKVRLLKQPGASFVMRPPQRVGTLADPSGATYVGRTVLMSAINANRVDINLTGLPANAVVSAGDYLSYNYGSPTMRAFHQVVDGANANGSGAAGPIQVMPPIPEGADAGTTTLWRNTYMHAVVVNEQTPGSSFRSVVSDSVVLGWRQLL